jgi:uncharacterized protein
MNAPEGSLRVVDRVDVRGWSGPARHDLLLDVVDRAGLARLQVPLTVLIGRTTGPCLALVAGIHGDEAEGIRAAIEITRELDPHEIRGSLLIVPIANPPAFEAHRRRSPVDDLDLNRSFPGNPHGTATERLASALFSLIEVNADFLYTLHSWFATGDAVPHVEIPADVEPALRNRCREAAAAAGFDLIRLADWHLGLLPAAVTRVGIPAMEAEVGGLGVLRAEHAGVYRQTFLRLMRHLGMIDGPEQPPAAGVLHTRTHVLSPVGGVLRSEVALGATVAAGSRLGSIESAHGALLASLVSPTSGVVVARREAVDTQPGDYAFSLLSPI